LIEYARASAKMGIILLLFYFLPPCLIAFTYFVEVIIFHCFTYIPAIFLMIFPIGFRAILYSLRLYCRKLQETFDETIIEKKLENGGREYSWGNNSSILPESRTEEVLAI